MVALRPPFTRLKSGEADADDSTVLPQHTGRAAYSLCVRPTRHRVMTEPFWETAYCDPGQTSVFGRPSEEVVELMRVLPPGVRVLDLGCGDGRHAVPLAECGFHVTAIDHSRAAIDALRRRAGAASNYLSAIVQDVEQYEFDTAFDAVIAHGILQLLAAPTRDHVLSSLREHTVPGGYNVVAVFTDSLPPPPDLAPVMRGLFREGELFACYSDWDVLVEKSYILEDEHPGGIRHRHPINKIVARRPQS